MDKLIAIAKECGAVGIITGKDDVVVHQFTDHQLHAYTEKVCKQLLFVVDQYYRLHGAVIAQEALATYNDIMGDKK